MLRVTGREKLPTSGCSEGPESVDAVVYRPRTTPETSINYAFFALEPFSVESWPLAERTDVVTNLVLSHGFTVGWELA